MAAIAVFLCLLGLSRADVVLFPYTSGDGSFGHPIDAEIGFGNSAPITAACEAALNQTVACDPQLPLLAASGYYMPPGELAPALCAPQCNASLAAYHSSVVSVCGATGAFDTYPNTYRGDLLWDYFNLVCTTDPATGGNCAQWIQDQLSASPQTALLDHPPSFLCSDCHLAYMRTVQDSVFLGYDLLKKRAFDAIYDICEVNLPTVPKPPPVDVFPGQTNETASAPSCASGNTYTVQPGDTCRSIAQASSVSEGSIAVVNDLWADCTRFTSNNETFTSLCLPLACETYEMAPDDNCWSVSDNHNITFAQFLAYNPAVNLDCSNLANSSVVCVSSPDGTYVPDVLEGVDPTGGSPYAEDAVDAPGPVPFGTTAGCGGYYQAQAGDICSRISLAARIPADLFMAINAGIDGECSNIIPGLWYCIRPTYWWNQTHLDNGTSTILPPPAPTPPGTTPQCYQWHVIVPGDTCFHLTTTLGATLAELREWNPSLDAECTNLLLDQAYCVRGPRVLPPSATPSSTPTPPPSSTASPTPTPSPPTNTCAQTYTVQPGDYCYLIYTSHSLTETQFRALNPELDTDCSLSIGQVLCVASSSSSPPITPSPTPTPTPTPTNCKTQYEVRQGDYCYLIWTTNSLSDTQFYALNPGLECDALQVGQRVCVAGCTARYTVAAGDYCFAIWTGHSLTEGEFYGLNPGLDCGLLEVGMGVCVAGVVGGGGGGGL